MRGGLVVLAIAVGCGSTATPSRSRSAGAPASPHGNGSRFRIRAAPARHADPIDATADQEARGGRPSWTPPPEVAGAIRVTLEALTPDARRCFTGTETNSIAIRFTVSAAGRASAVVVESPRARAASCFADAIRQADFPSSRRAWLVQYLFEL